MFKVSFKENPQFPIKKVQRFNGGKVTVVTLKGVAKLPVFLQYFIPHKIFDWADSLKHIDVEFTMSNLYITVTEESLCAKEDKVDKVLGERLAEARAKVSLYGFMFKFCNKVLDYFKNVLFGKDNNIHYVSCNNDALVDAIYKYRRLYKDEQKHLNILLGHESNTESSQKH